MCIDPSHLSARLCAIDVPFQNTRGNLEEAGRLFERAMSIDPCNINVMCTYAMFHLMAKRCVKILFRSNYCDAINARNICMCVCVRVCLCACVYSCMCAMYLMVHAISV